MNIFTVIEWCQDVSPVQPWIFKVKYGICYIWARNGPITMKQTCRLNSKPQMWPSNLTLAVTLTLNFKGQIWISLYLGQKSSNCYYVLISCYPYPVPIDDLWCVLPMSYQSLLLLMITDHIYHLFTVLCYMPIFIGMIMYACFILFHIVFFFLFTNPTPFGCYENKAIIIMKQKANVVDWTLSLKCDHRIWYWPWPWPYIFKLKYGICYILAKNGPIATKQKANISIELVASNVTIRFDLGHDLDFEFSRSNLEFAISRPKMVWLPQNGKYTIRMNWRPQWPSSLTLAMTLKSEV